MWCYQRMARSSWIEKLTNEQAIEKVPQRQTMSGSVERRTKRQSPTTLASYKRKSSVQPRRRYKRSNSRDGKPRAESAGDLGSRNKSCRGFVQPSSAAQHERSVNTPRSQEKSPVPPSKGCKLFPLDVTDCLKNANDWEAMEIRILDKDKCTVLRPNMSENQKSDKLIVHPSLHQTDHTIKGNIKSNQNTSRGSSVLKQTVCVEKVHVRNLLHTKREKCGNLGSSRSSEYMPSEATTAAGTLTAQTEIHNYLKIPGSNIGLPSTEQHSDASSCDSADTSDQESASAQSAHKHSIYGASRAKKESAQLSGVQDDKKQREDNSSSVESEDYINDNDKDSEDESSGSDDSDDDDDENEIDEVEEGQGSDHGDEDSAVSSVSDDSYYKKYYKEEKQNTKVKNTTEINAKTKQKVSQSEDAMPVTQFVSVKDTSEKHSAEYNTHCKNINPNPNRLNWQNPMSKQIIPTSHPIDYSGEKEYIKKHLRDRSVSPNQNEKPISHSPFYNEHLDMPFSTQQGEPALNLNEPSTSLSISDGKKWETLPHSRDGFSSTQSASTLSGVAARKTSFIPMPEEEIAQYKQIALQILTERKQRALEDNQSTNIQPMAPHNMVDVQSRPVSKKKRNRPSRKYHKSTRLKSKEAKSSEASQNINFRSSQRAGFWASWRIKNQIEKHRKRFHTTDVNTTKVCRSRNTHGFPIARCMQKSPKQSSHKARSSDVEHAAYFPGFMSSKFGSIKQKPISQPAGRVQSKRLSCQMSEMLKSKHENTIAGTKVSNASFKVQKPPTKTHSSLFGNHPVTGKKSPASIPLTMRSTQSHYYLKPTTNTHTGAAKATNMGVHASRDGKVRSHYEHGTKIYQMSGKTCTKQPNRICNTGQGKVCIAFANEKQNELNCESTSKEGGGKMKMTSHAGDTPVTKAASKSESFSKSVSKAASASNQFKLNLDNAININHNLPSKVGLTSLTDRENESFKTPLSTTTSNEQGATAGESAQNEPKPCTYLDLLQNVLKSPTAKAAQALGTFFQNPETQERTDQACDITVDQIISSYQKLFDQLYDLSSKNTVNTKLKINESLTQSLENSLTSTDMKMPKDTELQNTALSVLKKVPGAFQTHVKSAVIENKCHSSRAHSVELKSDKNVCLSESSARETSEPTVAGVDRNKPIWKSNENTKSIFHTAAQETATLSKNNTMQAGMRGRATSCAGMFRFQAKPYGNHDYRHIWRSATADKRSATENRLALRQNENRKSKSSHDSSEATKTTYKQFNPTQRKTALEVRCSRTPCVGSFQNNTNHQTRGWRRICKNVTIEMPNNPTSANTVKNISFSDSSCCGIKPKINTFLKTSFSCTRQPTGAAATRMHADESPLYRYKHTAPPKGLPDKLTTDGKKKCMEPTLTKSTHMGLINASGTSLQCMATIQSNPESSSRLTKKFLVHKECTSSIKAHALVTSGQASARVLTTDRTKRVGEGQQFMKDMGVVIRGPGADSVKRELSAQSLQIDGQYHQVQEHLNANRTVQYSSESTGMVRTYPAITIFAPQACLNILTPKSAASPQPSRIGDTETVNEAQVVKSVNSPNSQPCLQITADSEVSIGKPAESTGSNEDQTHDDKSSKEKKDTAGLKWKNTVSDRRPIRSALKSSSEQWTHRDENFYRRMQRDNPYGVASEGQKQVHFKSKSAFRYGLSASTSTLTHIPSQREQNTSALTRPCKKVACTTPSSIFSDAETELCQNTTEDRASVTNYNSSPTLRGAKVTHSAKSGQKNVTSAIDVGKMSVLLRDSSWKETDKNSSTKLHPKNLNEIEHISIKSVSSKKVKSEVCPAEELGSTKNKGTPADRKSSLSWSKQHLTKGQEVKDKRYVTSTALRAIFVTPFSPFHRVHENHRSDTEANRKPLAWQKRRCRSAEGFEIKNATSRFLTYGKKKLPSECFSSSSAGKSLKSDAQLRASASKCALYQNSSDGKVTDSGAAKNVEVKTEDFADTKSVGGISKIRHIVDAIRKVQNSSVKHHGPNKNSSPSHKEPKMYDKWNTPPWKTTLSEDESELSDGSSLQAVRKHIVANTCRMIIRESRNLIVSNLQRHTREDSPQKATPAETEGDYEPKEVHSHGGCEQMNRILNDAKESISLGAVLECNEISKIPKSEHNYETPDANMEMWESTAAARPSVFSSKPRTESLDCKIVVAKKHDLSTKITGKLTKNESGNLWAAPPENARSVKHEQSLHNTLACDDEGKNIDCDIKELYMLKMCPEQGKQDQPTNTVILCPVSESFPDKNIFHEAQRANQHLNINMAMDVIIQETKQMKFAEQQSRNVTVEGRDADHDSEYIHLGSQQNGNADAFPFENQDTRDQEEKTNGEGQQSTITERTSRGRVQSTKNAEQDSTGTEHKDVFPKPEDIMQTTKDNEKESKDKEQRIRQKEQENKNTAQKNRNADKGSGDVKHKSRKLEHEDDGNEQKMKTLEYDSRPTLLEIKALEHESTPIMQESRERAKQNGYTEQENGDTRQRSRNVDEKSAYTLQRCKNTEKRVADRQQDSIREQEQKSRITDEATIEHCSREIVQKRKEKGLKPREEGKHSKHMEHENSKQSRNTENESTDKWRKCRNIEKGKFETRQNSRSVERKKSDISQINKSTDHASTESWQQSRSVDKGITETGAEDTIIRRVKSQSRNVGYKNSDKGEERTEMMGKNTSAEQTREVGQKSRNGELTHRERGVHTNTLGEKTRKLAETNKETRQNKGSDTWLEENGSGHEQKHEDRYIRDKRYEQRGMLPEERNRRHEHRGTHIEQRDIMHEQRGADLEERDTRYKEGGTLLKDTNKRRERTDTYLEQRDTIHEQRDADKEERDKRHEQRDTDLQERDESHEQTVGGLEKINRREQSDVDLQDGDTWHEQRHRNLDDRDNKGRERYAYLDDRDAEQEERDTRYTNTDAHLQERDNESEWTDAELEERDYNYEKMDMELTRRDENEEHGKRRLDTVQKRRDTKEATHENTDIVHENTYFDESSCLRPNRHKKCISTENSPKARCTHLKNPGYETRKVSEKFKRQNKESRQFGQEIRGKAEKIGYNDKDNKDVRRQSRDTKLKSTSTSRKSRSAEYESNDSDPEYSRGMCQDIRGAGIEAKYRMHRASDKEHKTSTREEEIADSRQERMVEPYSTRNIEQSGRANTSQHIHHQSKMSVQASEHKDESEPVDSEDEVHFFATKKGHKERDEELETCGGQPQTDVATRERQHELQHKVASVANTTQTEETCLTAFASPRRDVQTRDQHTEIEEILVHLANDPDKKHIVETENVPRENNTHTTKEQQNSAESLTHQTDKITGPLYSTEELQTLNASPKNSEEMFDPRMYTMPKLNDMQINSQSKDSPRQIKQHNQGWENSKGSLFCDPAEINNTTKPLLPVAEMTTLLVKAVSSTDTLSSIKRSKGQNGGKQSKSYETLAKTASHNEEKIASSQYDGNYDWTRSTKRLWNTHRELLLSTDVNRMSKNLPAENQNLPADNCDVSALQQPPLSTLGHWGPNMSRDDAGLVNKSVMDIIHTDTDRWNLLPVLEHNAGTIAIDLSTRVGASIHNFAGSKEHSDFLFNVTTNDRMKAHTDHQQKNETKETEFQILVTEEQETAVNSRVLQTIDDNTHTNVKQDLVVMCESSIHATPVYQGVDSVDNVVYTTPAHTDLDKTDIRICETTSFDLAALQTKHRATLITETQQMERFISYRETNYPNDVSKHTEPESTGNTLTYSPDEVVEGHVCLPSHSTSSTGLFTTKSVQPSSLHDTHKTMQVASTISSIAFDNCGFHSKNIQPELHSKMSRRSVNSLSTGDLQNDTFVTKSAQCNSLDEPKPESENVFQIKHSASKTAVRGLGVCDEKLSEHFQRQGSPFPNFPKTTEAAHTEQNDLPERMHSDKVRASNSQEIVVRDTANGSEKFAEVSQPAHTTAGSRAVLDCTQHTPWSCFHSASKSHSATADGCTGQAERTRQLPGRVSFQDECHMSSTSNYGQVIVTEAGTEKQQENETHQSKLEKHTIDTDNNKRYEFLDSKTTWKYSARIEEQASAIEVSPHEDSSCLHCVRVAMEQSASIAPSSNSSDHVDTGDSNKAIKQECTDPRRGHLSEETIDVRTRERAFNSQENVIHHSLDNIRPRHSDRSSMHSSMGHSRDVPHGTTSEGKQSSADTSVTWKKGNNNSTKSVQTETMQDIASAVNNMADTHTCHGDDHVRAQLTTKQSLQAKSSHETSTQTLLKQSLQAKSSHETSTQTLLKQSDFEDSLKIIQSSIKDKKGQVTVLRDTCIGTSDAGTECDLHPADTGTSRHDETVTLDESFSGVPQATSTAGYVKSMCSPLSSISSKTEGVIRRVLSRSPDTKNTHIQQKAMENLELFVKSTRVCASEPRTSPPCKPSSQSSSTYHQREFLKDFVIRTPLQHTPSFLDFDASLKDTKMHTDCSESIVTYSKPSTENAQIHNNANKQTSPHTEPKTFLKPSPNTQAWANSTSVAGSYSPTRICGNKLHLLDCSKTISIKPDNSQLNVGNDICWKMCQEVTQKTLQEDHSLLHMPPWPNVKSSIFSSQNDDIMQNIIEPTRACNLQVTNNEMSKAVLVTSAEETYNICLAEEETCNVCSLEDERQASHGPVTNAPPPTLSTQGETKAPSLFYKASCKAITESNNTEKSQSASFTRSYTNPFLHTSTNPFMPSAPLIMVPDSKLEPLSSIDVPRQPPYSRSLGTNPFLNTKAKQLTFDVGKLADDWSRSMSSRKDSPDSSTCFCKDNRHNKLSLPAIEEFISPLTATSEKRFESLQHNSGSNTLDKSSLRYLKTEDDLMLFSDASRDTDDMKREAESKCLKNDTGVRLKPACPLIILTNSEDSMLATPDGHWVQVQDRDDAHLTSKQSSNQVADAKDFSKQETRKRRLKKLNSVTDVKTRKHTDSVHRKHTNSIHRKHADSLHRKHTLLAEKARQIGCLVDNSDDLESANKTSPDSFNNSISDDLTSQCLLLKKRHGLHKPSASYVTYNSSEESIGGALTYVSSSSASLNSHISSHRSDHSDDIRHGRQSVPSPSFCQTQVNSETANLDILETVTTLTSKFIDIFNGLKKNIHKSTGRRCWKHKMPNVDRHRHYYYTPVSKNAYPYRRSRNESKKPYYSSQQKTGRCHQEKHFRAVLPKNHSQVHNQYTYKLHKYAGKRSPTAIKKSSIVKSPNTVTSTQSEDHASTSNSSQQRIHFHRRKKRRDKINDEFSISPHVYTEYKRLPVCSSNSDSLKLRAVSSHANKITDEIRPYMNQPTVSDIKSNVSSTAEQTAVKMESAEDHIVTQEESTHAPFMQCYENHHSCPEYLPHVFVPQYSHLYVSVSSGGCYVMPNMPFLSTVFTIVDDNYETYLSEQHNSVPKLVLVEDEEDAGGGKVETDTSVTAMIQTTRKQSTPLLPATDQNDIRCKQEADSYDIANMHTVKLNQRESKHTAKPAPGLSNGNLCESMQPGNDNFAHYVDVVPLLPKAEIMSKDTCTKQDDTCEALGEILDLAKGLENSWQETRLYEPYRKYASELRTDRYDTVVNVNSTIHSDTSSSNLDCELARFSASGFPSHHGQYYIKDDLSSPPKRSKCDHSNRTTCPAGASISKQTIETGQDESRVYHETGQDESRVYHETGQDESRVYHQMDPKRGCDKIPRTTNFPMPSMTFENRLKGYRKDITPYLCQENVRTPYKFLHKIKDSPFKEGGPSITYSHRGRRGYFSHILGVASPVSDSLTDCSEKRESSTEIEVKAKTKDDKQYHYDDCEPDTYDELGSLCSEMQDTTSKLYQGDAEYGLCKDPTCSYESKSVTLGPTFEALLGKELTATPNSISNAATQTIHQVKRCTSCSHCSVATRECGKKEAATSRLVAENNIYQLPTEHACQFPTEQGYQLPTGQDCQLPAGYLEDLGNKNLTASIWNMGFNIARSAPVTRSCFTQTERGASGQESNRPNLAEIRDLMGRCIKSRHFRYYVQHIVDERVRNTLRQKVFSENGGNRNEKARVTPWQKRNNKQQPLNDADAHGSTSAGLDVVQASLPSFACQEHVTDEEEPIIAAVKSLLSRKSSSNDSICAKHDSRESQNEAGKTKLRRPPDVQHYGTFQTRNKLKDNNEHLTNRTHLENTMPDDTNNVLQNPKKPSSFNSKDASNDNATNDIVSRSLPIMQNASKEGPDDRNIKIWNRAAQTEQTQKSSVSPLHRINNGSTKYFVGLTSIQEHNSVNVSEKNISILSIAETTDVNSCGHGTAETAHVFDNSHVLGQKATRSQREALNVGADCTNNTQLAVSPLLDKNTIHAAGLLHNEPAFHDRGICEVDESVGTRPASTDCACLVSRDAGAQEVSDMSSSSSTKIDYGRLKNVMSAETKLLWKNLTRLENSYDRCKRCRKQYESILGSNKISGECETKSEKLDTACELYSEDFNITRWSTQSTEMTDEGPQEKCISKNEDDVIINTELPTEENQEHIVIGVADNSPRQVFNEVNTPAVQEANNTTRVEHTRAACLTSSKDSSPKLENQLDMSKTMKEEALKKPWHVKGKHTAKIIQIFERGNGFFQDNEQEHSSNENNTKHECCNNEQGNQDISSNQQPQINLKKKESKWTDNAVSVCTKKLQRSTAIDDEAKLNYPERTTEYDDRTKKLEKAHEISSNTKCTHAVKIASDKSDVVNQHTLAPTPNITDAQHILAMNAPNSETDEWIQKLVNILHEMQQAFPQISGTSANPVLAQNQVDQTKEDRHLSEKHPHSPLQVVSGKLHETNQDVIYKSDLRWQRKTPANTSSLEHQTGTPELEHSHTTSMPCFLSHVNSKDVKVGFDKRVLHAKKLENYVHGKDNKPFDSGMTEEMRDTATQKITQESLKTDRVKILEIDQQRHTAFSWLIKSADFTSDLVSNTDKCSELESPDKCKDENNQASGSLLPTELLSYQNAHMYDMVVADDDKKHSFCEPCYATRHNLNRQCSQHSLGEPCCATRHNPNRQCSQHKFGEPCCSTRHNLNRQCSQHSLGEPCCSTRHNLNRQCSQHSLGEPCCSTRHNLNRQCSQHSLGEPCCATRHNPNRQCSQHKFGEPCCSTRHNLNRQCSQHSLGEPCCATRHNLNTSSRYTCRDSCNYKSVLDSAATISCDEKDIRNTTSSMKTMGIIRKVQSCIAITSSYSSSDWTINKYNLYSNQLKNSKSENKIQMLFEIPHSAQDVRYKNGSQLGKSKGVTNITQDIFTMSSCKTPRQLDDHEAKMPKESTQFDWSKLTQPEVHTCQTNITMLQVNRHNESAVCSASRDITSKCRTKVVSKSRIPDCHTVESSMDSRNKMANKQLKTDMLCLRHEMDHRLTQQDDENSGNEFNQGLQRVQETVTEYTNEIRDECDIYEQNTHNIDEEPSSKMQKRSNMFKSDKSSCSAETTQSSRRHTWKHISGIPSLMFEEGPEFGENYDLTMGTMNDVKDTSLISNNDDDDFIDDIDTSVVRGSDNLDDSIDGSYPVKNKKNNSHNARQCELDPLRIFDEPKVPMKKPQECSHVGSCECLAENRTDDRSSHFPWKERGRKCRSFRKKDDTYTITYNISAKRFCGNRKQHKSASPPSVSLKQYISNGSDTVRSKEMSSCLHSSKIMSATVSKSKIKSTTVSTSGELDSKSQQTTHLQSFDIPIDIYTMPVYRSTSPQKKRKKKADIPTRTVVISGPVRNMSIGVQRHMRSFDGAGFTNGSTLTQISSPDLAERSSPTDRDTTDQITVSGYDRKSVPNWRHAMKRILPFGKRTTSHEKKTQAHLVT